MLKKHPYAELFLGPPNKGSKMHYLMVNEQYVDL